MGTFGSLSFSDGQPAWEDVAHFEVGIGRLAMSRAAGPTVFYVGLDDGRVLRLARGPGGPGGSGEWITETVYSGPQGLRGLVAGRFHADPDMETLAVFGYSAEVVLLSRRPGEDWKHETLFVDRERGHWLAVAELDGRNTTDEILGSGYGGRVFLLSRPASTP